MPDGLDGYLIRRAVECATITYDQLTAGTMPGGANRARRLPVEVFKQMLLRLLDDPQISGEDRDFPAPFRSSSIDWHKRPSALVPLIMGR